MARRGENIHKRADGRWEGRYIVSYSQDGKAKYKSVYGSTYSETKEKLNQYKAWHIQCDVYMNMTDLCREWLKIKSDTIKLSSYIKYYNFTENHFIPYFGNMEMQRLNAESVQDFIRQKKELSEKTIRDMIAVLTQIIRYGQSKQYVAYFDFNSIICPKSTAQELKVLQPCELKKLVNYLQSSFDIQKIGIMLSLFMGIRLGEVCALQWQDIDLTQEVVHINKTMQRLKNLEGDCLHKTKIVIDTPKSQKSIRTIPIPSFLISMLKENKGNERAYVLTGTSDYIEPSIYERMFHRYLLEADVKDTNFHALRHTFATQAVEQGFDIKSLSEILGHSSVKFTMERYVHPSDSHKKMNLEKMKIFY